ncbi:MAG: hypothetical protein JJ908_12055 [Rhizobiales bacterium]|nr:hypothetical protein [Hyphomicrobiales bacterium]MBO6699558.1 hypothetical protein [Hyphomicrobiales bacterium]MBO6737096.1 hypothetical protein [Hyphomicrobiales bacterium]MBO6911830.1 hypothetical protein [Hyphomicrobiales bacterium]MBO6954767.1 hypothetical protein [Hyphomicrobiales bacterium]
MWHHLTAVFAALASLVLTTTGPALAEDCVRWSEDLPTTGIVTEYVTDITAEDLTNSRGVQLTDYRAILQQDRFNHHERGVIDGSHLDDGSFRPFQGEAYFTTRDRRQQISQGDFSLVCPDQLDDLAGQILRGRLQGFLFVRAYGGKGGGLRFYIALVG